MAEARFVAAQLHTQYHEYADRNHFLDDTFPEVLAIVEAVVVQQTAAATVSSVP